MAENRAIGKNNSLPWHLSEDLKYFKRVTMGHSIIMGRKTWDSIGRALPGRTSIVVTRNPQFVAEGAKVVDSLASAIELAKEIAKSDGTEEAFVIGGAAIYEAALPHAQRFHLTRVHSKIDGDTFLTGFEESDWDEVSRDEYHQSDTSFYDYSICVLERVAT